jgi:hypothetical protein
MGERLDVKLSFYVPEREREIRRSVKGAHEGYEHVPRSSRSLSMVTRSVAERRSSESIKQQRSMSNHQRESGGGTTRVVRHRYQLAEGTREVLVRAGAHRNCGG